MVTEVVVILARKSPTADSRPKIMRLIIIILTLIRLTLNGQCGILTLHCGNPNYH